MNFRPRTASPYHPTCELSSASAQRVSDGPSLSQFTLDSRKLLPSHHSYCQEIRICYNSMSASPAHALLPALCSCSKQFETSQWNNLSGRKYNLKEVWNFAFSIMFMSPFFTFSTIPACFFWAPNLHVLHLQHAFLLKSFWNSGQVRKGKGKYKQLWVNVANWVKVRLLHVRSIVPGGCCGDEH